MSERVSDEELFEKHSEQIGDDISSLSYWEGRNVLTKEEFMKALQERREQEKWISVKERLPNENDFKSDYYYSHNKTWDAPEVLYSSWTHDSPDGHMEHWWSKEGSNEPIIADGEDEEEMFLPTHWQPLPQPPKEQS